MKKFTITFIKTKFNTYPIIDISKESYILNYFKYLFLKNNSADLCNDVFYKDEIDLLNLKDLEFGVYDISGEIVDIISEYEFVNLEINKSKWNILESD